MGLGFSGIRDQRSGIRVKGFKVLGQKGFGFGGWGIKAGLGFGFGHVGVLWIRFRSLEFGVWGFGFRIGGHKPGYICFEILAHMLRVHGGA